MVDRDGRLKAIESAENGLLRSQREHVARFEALENMYKLDLDVVTDIFGVGVLNGSHEVSKQVLQQFETLFEALADPKDLLFVSGAKVELSPGCRGFGGDPGTEIALRGALFMDARSVKIECVSGDHDGGAAIILHGRGVPLDDHTQSPAINEDNETYTGPLVNASSVSLRIAGSDPLVPGSDMLTTVSRMSLVVNTDEPLDMYRAAQSLKGGRRGLVDGWLLNFATEYERRVRQGILIG